MGKAVRSILAVLALCAAMAIGLLWLAEPALRFGLRLAGVATVQFEDLHLDLSGVELEGLRFGGPPEAQVARLRIGYRLPELLRGRLEKVEIDGLSVAGRIADGRVQVAGFDIAADGASRDAPPLPLPVPEHILLQSAQVELETIAGRLVLPLAGEARRVENRAEFRLTVEGGRLLADPGTVAEIDARFSGQAPTDRPFALETVTADGSLELTAHAAAIPELAAGIDGEGSIQARLYDGLLEAEARGLRLEVQRLAPRLQAVATVLPPPWRVALGGDAAPVRVRARLAGAVIDLEASGSASLATPQPQADARFTAALVLGRDGGVRAVRPSQATLEVRDLNWQEASLRAGRLELAASGGAERLEGMIDLDLAGHGSPLPGLVLEDAALRQRFAALLADGALSVWARQPGLVQAASLAWGENLRTGPITVQVEPSETPWLRARIEHGTMAEWRHALSARIDPVDATIQAGGARVELSPAVDQLLLMLEGDARGLGAGRVDLGGGRVRMPEQRLALGGITAMLGFDRNGLAPGEAIPLAVGTIAHDATPAWFAPLALDATLRPTDGQLAFEARLGQAGSNLELTVTGRHDLAGGGQASIDLAPVTFAPGGLQPARLAPALGDLLDRVSGALAVDGGLTWRAGAGEVSADLALSLDQLAFGIRGARFEGVDGLVRFDRAWPPTTPRGQQLAVALIDVGLPLTRGFLTFQLQPDRTLAVEQLRWRAAGGTVRAEPFTVGSDVAELTVTLRAEGLDLAQIFELIRLDGLTGEGTINGVLPIVLSGSDATVAGGELVATRPGWLRYQPVAPPSALQAGGESVGLLLQALENFRYEALKITLDGHTDAAMDIGLHIDGANPELYGGHPVQFNLNLEGELANVLREGLAGYRIPEQVRERMQGVSP